MNDLGAFVPHAPRADYGPSPKGPLAGLTLSVKDLFDVAGLRTGGGTPAWLEGPGAQPAVNDAPAVSRLRAAGAQFIGKTVTDELAWSLNGENVHYGTPENPAAPGRIPGGSSAGSAAAVAGGLCDIGLGTDTGGSVRLPASYCGLWAIRPTHGRISLDGTVPLAPSYDTVGWFARDAATLARAGQVFFEPAAPMAPRQVIIAADLFDRVVPQVRSDLLRAARALAARLNAPCAEMAIAPEGLDAWRDAFRICQTAEVWATHGAWVTRANPAFGPGISERFAMARALTDQAVSVARAARGKIAAHLHQLTREAVIIVPGAGAPAPLRGEAGPALDATRNRALELLCAAGHGGLPQLALPALKTDEGPVGLGLIAAQGADAALLALGRTLAEDAE